MNKLKLLDEYWYWNGSEPVHTKMDSKFTDIILITIGNCFRTRVECQQKGKVIEKQLRDMLDKGITLAGFKDVGSK